MLRVYLEFQLIFLSNRLSSRRFQLYIVYNPTTTTTTTTLTKIIYY